MQSEKQKSEFDLREQVNCQSSVSENMGYNLKHIVNVITFLKLKLFEKRIE